ncbi:DnaD domain protein [Floricoccus penangensis]|uniref:DnaD domain protein n=1 Tax=Floricoccus penangensis TaxID=1859475 RepID=UPI0020403F46|nr:DnaD domain protein [Floricoccus penangensis]URZ87212.1 DnaD domain protein [Floricoccus penangensis]
MAQRRMFSKEITTSDKFVDMPQSCQLLYFHLGMEADDEGFIGNAKMLSRAYGSNNDDLNILFAKNFLIPFETGVVVIKDWNVNNKLRKDRAKETIYLKEKALLTVDDSGVYQSATNCQPIDNQTTTNCPHRLGKDSIVEDSIVQSSLEEKNEKTDDDGGGKSENKFQEIINATQQIMPVINQLVSQNIHDDYEEYGYDLMMSAIKYSASSGARTYKYVSNKLASWESKGVKNVEDAKRIEEYQPNNNKSLDSQEIVDGPF